MKRIILLVLIILINLFLIGCAESEVYLNKNNEDLKDINKEELESIVDEYSSYAIDEIYVADTKIVGFSSDTTQGVFVYEKDNEGNYVLNQANKLDIPTDGLGISNYRIIYEKRCITSIYFSISFGSIPLVIFSTNSLCILYSFITIGLDFSVNFRC